MSTDAPQQISTQSPAAAEAVSTVACAICRRQFARYTCPRCNIPYCSLTCFRSESHNGCSETFYRQELEADVHSSPSRTTEERLKMMELLRQFEEGAADADLLGETDSDNEGEDVDLVRRLGKVDLESVSSEELWAKLTPAERDKFLRALGDPSSELAQQLLASEELEKARVEPWWEAQPSVAEDADAVVEGRALPENATRKRFGARPEMMDVPLAMVHAATASVGSAPILLYNMCALCMAYAYTTRHLAMSPLSALSLGDPEHAEACRTIAHLAPFLADRKSATIHPTLSSVVTDFWSRFEPGKMTSPFLSVLLRDTAILLRPAPVTVLRRATSSGSDRGVSGALRESTQAQDGRADLASHPNALAILALSDLFALFQAAPRATQIPAPPEPPEPLPSSVPPLPSGMPTSIPLSVPPPLTSGAAPHPPSPERVRGSKHIPHKLTFYAAHVLGAPTAMLRVLADEVAVRAQAVAREGADVDWEGPSTGVAAASRDREAMRETFPTGNPVIEELP
ncbi:hypothetical protein BKA93DRAFT_816514 [Sparassis latifolia]|uniref:HIT-type domain-containing protein n=1 Tax=Sparassis crispa TaxID=139825 RepID=A0A401GWU0_9APHY|nr:hypothetical protein SCP_0901130 [Sparassis crispa]GBE86234.1 hypothetical protein SCP_0901130 [Sparassis crispa]